MPSQLASTSTRRRSDRVTIAFPIELAGTDFGGETFSERAETTTVSRYGCCVALRRTLRLGHRVQMQRPGMNEPTGARVVSWMGNEGDRLLYGVETSQPCEALWGIRFSSSFYERILDSLQDGVYFTNRERRITFWNEAAERLSGYAANEVVGKRCFDNLLGHVDEDGKELCRGECPLSGVMADGEARQAEVYLRHKEGHRVPVLVRALPMRNSAGVIVGVVEVFSDASIRRNSDRRVQELEHLAFRDPLTGLANRRYLEMKVHQALEEHRSFGRKFGLLMVDLDGFKQVNDIHGHESGDALLRAVAETLNQGLRPADSVGRWGGEEFLVLLPDLDATQLGDLAERCRVLIGRTGIGMEIRIGVTASIGATFLTYGDDSGAAIRRADELMYQSKRSGGDRTNVG